MTLSKISPLFSAELSHVAATLESQTPDKRKGRFLKDQPGVGSSDGQPRSSDPDAPYGVADAAWCQTPSAPSLTGSSRDPAGKDQDVGQPA